MSFQLSRRQILSSGLVWIAALPVCRARVGAGLAGEADQDRLSVTRRAA